ncbi:PREDICTED: uncharacterized protein LOC109114905 [Nelumbo nucifera]|uniref:Uncharacterized protein LOC109114905 n=1 Tax=Nelumbo nucifera TaxID=4432 RepID=A0A1U8Q5H6_NELNU|nr:PREDICTED: uncharacterized protein LOC109114905 [Nelumbo nucifera]
MNDNERISVSFNKRGQPEDGKLSQFIGTIARNGNIVPVDVWIDKFDVLDDRKEWCLKDLNAKWKQWKCILYPDFYKPEVPIAEQLTPPMDRVVKEQWVNLLQMWQSEKIKTFSKVNKSSRALKKINHCVGTKRRSKFMIQSKGREYDASAYNQLFRCNEDNFSPSFRNEDTVCCCSNNLKSRIRVFLPGKSGSLSLEPLKSWKAPPHKAHSLRVGQRRLNVQKVQLE